MSSFSRSRAQVSSITMRPILEHVAVVRDRSAPCCAFCSTSRMVVPRSRLMRTDDLEDLAGQLGREAEARLVEQDQLRRAPSARARSPASAAGRPRAARPPASRALAQDREVAVDTASRSRADAVAVAARVGAHQQVVVAPTAAGTPRALRARGTRPRCTIASGRIAVMLCARELDAALARVDDAGDGLQDRGLAGAVGAEHGDDLAALDREADAADRLDRAVRALDVEELEDGRSSQLSAPSAAIAACSAIATAASTRSSAPR